MIVCDSVTKLPPDGEGHAVLSGSHCGVVAAYLAVRGGARAVILNDAGVGRDRAGIGGLDYLQKLGVAAAAVSHLSARIGDGADMARRGVISHANGFAQSLGIAAGMATHDAWQLLERNLPAAIAPFVPMSELRFEGLSPGVVVVDSASLVQPDDADRIVITGSHGGVLGGRPETALRVAARAAVFNDAGVGIDDAGVSRLPALAERGIAAATVSCASARIGDGRSTLLDGIISHVNEVARRRGAAPGISTTAFCDLFETRQSKGQLP